jgi:tRNA U34 5-carboxymethylaminomethyl modifying GTPase MnmE/TrmE
MERTATVDELEERIKQLERTPNTPKRDENIYLQTRQVMALERIADALETGIQPPWLIDMLKTHTEQIGTLTYKVDKLTGGKSVVDLLMEGTVSPE